MDMTAHIPSPQVPQYIHISWVRYIETVCSINNCPTCERPRRMLCQHQEWYGWTVTCAGCGDRWENGYLCERPFERGWRKERIEYARAGLAEIGIQA